MRTKWWIQFSVQAILFLIGTGGIFVPQINTWLFAGIFWGIAFIWLVITLFLYLKSKRISKLNHPDISEQNKENDYAHKKIVEVKLPLFMEITNTLQEMTKYQNNKILPVLLNRELSLRKLADVQKDLQQRLNVNPRKDYPYLADNAKLSAIIKQTEKLKSRNVNVDEFVIKTLLAITWALEKNGYGISQMLEADDYQVFVNQLKTQTSKISREKAKESIWAYQDLQIGFNSEIFLISKLPKDIESSIPIAISKPISQMKHDRDEILDMLLQIISKELEIELK